MMTAWQHDCPGVGKKELGSPIRSIRLILGLNHEHKNRGRPSTRAPIPRKVPG